MVRYSSKALLLLALSGLSTSVSAVEWTVHPVRLPTPLSDHSATVINSTTAVLAGGCNSTLGNEFVDMTEPDMDFFACSTLTRDVWAFQPEDWRWDEESGGTRQFVKLAEMPRERYRHGAAVTPDGKTLILVGGRTVEDGMIPEIDVYDVTTDTWSTPATLPTSLQTADNAAFVSSDGSLLYVAGGYYGPDYETLDRVFTIDLTKLLASTPELETATVASLGTVRGDVHAVVTSDGKYAYVAGGFNHLNDFCSPLNSTERYSFAENEWTTVAPLAQGRGDKALVLLRERVYAIGGESRPDDWCDDKDGGNLVRDQSQVLDDVEVFDPTAGSDGMGKWTFIDSIPNAKFRFAAVPWESANVIYALGGQEPLDAECNCHRTSDVVASIDFDGSSAPRTMAVSIGIGAVAGAVLYGALALM